MQITPQHREIAQHHYHRNTAIIKLVTDIAREERASSA